MIDTKNNKSYYEQSEDDSTHLKKLFEAIGKDEFKKFITLTFGHAKINRNNIYDNGEIDFHQFAVMLQDIRIFQQIDKEEPINKFALLDAIIQYTNEQCKDIKAPHYKAWCEFVEGINHKDPKPPEIPEIDRVGTWAKNKDDFEIVSPQATLSEVASKFSKEAVCAVLVVEKKELLRMITMSCVTKEEEKLKEQAEPKKPVYAKDFGTEKEKIIMFFENSHMQDVHKRLLIDNKAPKIKQVLVEFQDGSYGIVSERETYLWKHPEIKNSTT